MEPLNYEQVQPIRYESNYIDHGYEPHGQLKGRASASLLEKPHC